MMKSCQKISLHREPEDGTFVWVKYRRWFRQLGVFFVSICPSFSLEDVILLANEYFIKPNRFEAIYCNLNVDINDPDLKID